MFNVAFLCLRDKDIPEPLCAEEVIGPAIFQHANTLKDDQSLYYTILQQKHLPNTFWKISKPLFMKLFPWKDKSRWECSTICTNTLNDGCELQVCTAEFVVGLMSMRYEEFN